MRSKILLALFLSFAMRGISQVPAADNPTGNANYNMNWIMSWVNDGSGNMLSANKTIFDNSGRQMQVQNKVFYRSNSTTTYTHVLASQVVRDVYGREVLNTLTAPIDYADFIYMPGFIQATDGTNYTYKNFDQFDPSGTPTDLTNSPQPVGGQSTKGTLGWYYGASNNWEPYTATSNFPYDRESIYQDGSNNKKKQAGVGEAFVMGSNHETSGYTTPVSGELANYILIRNRFFSSTQVGALATTLVNDAMQTVGRDANANERVSIADKGGNVLMTARPGTDLIVNNTIGLIGPSAVNYNQQVVSSPGSNFTIQALGGANNLNVYLVSSSGAITPVYTGVAAAYPFNSAISGTGTLVILSDAAFAVIYANSTAQYTVNSSTFASSGTPTLGYFKILANNTPVTITGSYTLYDMNAEAPTSLSSGNLNKGYYKVVANTGVVNVTYSNGYTDVAYNFYNQLGQLVASVPPNGVKLLEGTGYTNYSTLASIPYVSLYTYDTRGRLFSSSRPDNGLTQFYYRLDGKVRFSQNALQAATGSYCFVNYDRWGRMIETGQYLPGTGGVAFGGTTMTSILETTALWGGLTNGTMTDVMITNYDVADATYNVAANVALYLQDANYLGGKASTSIRYSSIVNNTPASANLVSETWYNYNEEGKVVWTIKYIPVLGLNGYKSTDYTYDVLGRLTQKVFQANVAAETFVHYYQYDAANGSLYQVYTSTTNSGISSATLQATYIYYLHGGLKRIQLATNLQGIDYTYTLQGALKAINNNNNTSGTNHDPGNDATTTDGFNPDAFGEVLDYFPGDYNNTRTTGIVPFNGVNTTALVPTESYAGNIKAMSWYSNKPSGLGGSTAPNAYVYNYDPKYQLIAGTWSNSLNFGTTPTGFTPTNTNQESVVIPGTGTPGTSTPGTPAYDGNGNILNLQRTGAQSDIFAYNYKPNTNQLAAISNTGTSGDSYTYSYDASGREISETTSNPLFDKYMQYDATGKVTLVSRNSSFTEPMVGFVYDEAGQRIEKLTYSNTYQLSKVTYYYGGVVYTQPVNAGTYGALTALEYDVQGITGRLGIYLRGSGTYAYELTDHLGNVRAVIQTTGAMQSATDYYPFGMMLANLGPTYRYGYQGQNSEADLESGWNSFELRMYNPRLGKWFTPDPAQQYFSPYMAMGNNPLSNIDPTGAFNPPTNGDYTVGQAWFDDDGSWLYMGGYWQGIETTSSESVFMVGNVMTPVTVSPETSLNGEISEVMDPGDGGEDDWINVTHTLVFSRPLGPPILSYYGKAQITGARSIKNKEAGKIGSININYEIEGIHVKPVSVDINGGHVVLTINNKGGIQGGLSVFGTTLKGGIGSLYPLSFSGSLEWETGNLTAMGVEANFTPNSNFYRDGALIVVGTVVVIASGGAAAPAVASLGPLAYF
jgi:RHS repeat-associated protein